MGNSEEDDSIERQSIPVHDEDKEWLVKSMAVGLNGWT
jgi:hypothetical protein